MKIFDIIKENEGFSAKPYTCTAGKITIGYGRNLTDVGISKIEAEILLHHDINTAFHTIKSVFGQDFIFKCDRDRLNALVDMAFNMGPSGFGSFKKMIKAIKENDWDTAAKEAKDSEWYKQTGDRAKRNVELLKGGDNVKI